MTELPDTNAQFDHVPVLLDEVLDVLDLATGQTYVDLTAGLGGHAAQAAQRIGETGTIVLIDLDPENLSRAAERIRALKNAPSVLTIRGNFADAPRELAKQGVAADAALADLGFSSSQMDDASRGLSIRADGPLDMRLDQSNPITARELVMSLDARELARIFKRFGEEPNANAIARAIVGQRQTKPIDTTQQLAAIVRVASRSHARKGAGKIDPSTRVFQALRIAVNDELGSLDRLLSAITRAAETCEDCPHNRHDRTAAQPAQPSRWLAPCARIAIISFHSLEDRPVKRSLRALVEANHAEWINRRLLRPDDGEVAANPRSRSAKLRAIRLSK